MNARFEEYWAAEFTETVPLPHSLHEQHPERWVRFHHLPESKRIPSDEDEIRTVLARHDIVMEHLFMPDNLVVVSGQFLTQGDTTFPDEDLDALAGPFRYWQTLQDPGDEFEAPMSLFVGSCTYDGGREQILAKTATWQLANLFFCQPPTPVLYHPYDGGMDVIVEHAQFRDLLKETFRDWLSAHPEGL
ncbi:MAG: hypothetical protein AAFZ38_10640 [Myxococcota bacterium]